MLHGPLTHLLPALTFHVMNGAGTLAEHFFQLFNADLADSSWSERRARLPWESFAELMQRALRPRAIRRRHGDAFWRGWRLGDWVAQSASRRHWAPRSVRVGPGAQSVGAIGGAR